MKVKASIQIFVGFLVLSDHLLAETLVRRTCKDLNFWTSSRWDYFVKQEPGIQTAFDQFGTLYDQTRAELVTRGNGTVIRTSPCSSSTVPSSFVPISDNCCGCSSGKTTLYPTNCVVDLPADNGQWVDGTAAVIADSQWISKKGTLYHQGFLISFSVKAVLEKGDKEKSIVFDKVEAFYFCRNRKQCEKLPQMSGGSGNASSSPWVLLKPEAEETVR